ncbi:MAG TPA: choice-of-anchor B family protein [Bacteroidia bacterium]|nr:choice-of-anchor B family protein [Bacteroidia bacterium]
MKSRIAEKKYLLIITVLIFFQQEILAQYSHQNINLLSVWDDTTVVPEPYYGIRYQGCTGWVDTASGREYAVIGSSKPGTYIVEVTNPVAPVMRDYIPGIGNANKSIWHEYQSYGKYLYIVSDDGGPNTFQIADMSYLPDSVHLVHNDSSIFKRSHTIFIDGDKLYGGSVTRPGGIYYSMAVYSLANPESPLLLRTLNDDYGFIGHAHDMFARNDTVYASCGSQGLYIFKLNANNTFTQISNFPNPSNDYNHSSFLSDDGSTLINCNEVPTGLPVNILDVSDLFNIAVADTILSPTSDTATPHNPYIKNGRGVIAYYQDGIQIYDISTSTNVTRIGYFDTNPTNGAGLPNPDYSGCWGAYPFLPSNIILASDMQNGLFVLEADTILAVGMESAASKNKDVSSVYPNPAQATIFLDYQSASEFTAAISVVDINGKTVLFRMEKLRKGKNHFSVDVSSLAEGIYALTLSGNSGIVSSRKFIRVN